MLLSTSHKFVYVHVPRTAGSSIEQVLRPWARAGVNNITGKLIYRLRQPSLWQHCHFRHHERMRSLNMRLPVSLREALYSFAFVRNPFDWLVSLYEYQRQLPSHRRHNKIRAMDFAAYVDYEIARNRRHQWPLICDQHKQCLLRAVGRYESLAADFASICSHVGLSAPDLPQVNTSRHRDYRSYYDAALIAQVAAHWHNDLRLFGYDFESWQQPQTSCAVPWL